MARVAHLTQSRAGVVNVSASPAQRAPARAAVRVLTASFLSATLFVSEPALAESGPSGLGSIEVPQSVGSVIGSVMEGRKEAERREREAEKSFQESDFLKGLKAKSEENKARRKRELEDKYCRRQAELGVGDCAGLRDIPGMTSSGRQKPPKAIMDLFGLTDEDYDGIQGN